jgi:hypothetical protein
MRIALLASTIVGLAALPCAAFADSLGRPCTDKPESEYLTLESLKGKVVEQGYQIRSGEIRKACGEFYVLDKNGKKAELFVDPTTGRIVAGDGKGETGMTGDQGGNRSVQSAGLDDSKRVANGAADGGDDNDGDD